MSGRGTLKILVFVDCGVIDDGAGGVGPRGDPLVEPVVTDHSVEKDLSGIVTFAITGFARKRWAGRLRL